MPKKAKGGGGGGDAEGKEKPPNEKEQLLINEVNALNEQLAKVLAEREKFKVGYDELTAKLAKQERDRQDQADYLKHELDKTRKEVSTLEEKFLALETSKENLQRRMDNQLAEASATASAKHSWVDLPVLT